MISKPIHKSFWPTEVFGELVDSPEGGEITRGSHARTCARRRKSVPTNHLEGGIISHHVETEWRQALRSPPRRRLRGDVFPAQAYFRRAREENRTPDLRIASNYFAVAAQPLYVTARHLTRTFLPWCCHINEHVFPSLATSLGDQLERAYRRCRYVPAHHTLSTHVEFSRPAL